MKHCARRGWLCKNKCTSAGAGALHPDEHDLDESFAPLRRCLSVAGLICSIVNQCSQRANRKLRSNSPGTGGHCYASTIQTPAFRVRGTRRSPDRSKDTFSLFWSSSGDFALRIAGDIVNPYSFVRSRLNNVNERQHRHSPPDPQSQLMSCCGSREGGGPPSGGLRSGRSHRTGRPSSMFLPSRFTAHHIVNRLKNRARRA